MSKITGFDTTTAWGNINSDWSKPQVICVPSRLITHWNLIRRLSQYQEFKLKIVTRHLFKRYNHKSQMSSAHPWFAVWIYSLSSDRTCLMMAPRFLLSPTDQVMLTYNINYINGNHSISSTLFHRKKHGRSTDDNSRINDPRVAAEMARRLRISQEGELFLKPIVRPHFKSKNYASS